MDDMGGRHEDKWFGGVSAGQDVSICLVGQGSAPEDSAVHQRETLAVVRVHSSVLSIYSKYFSTCLSERWRNSSPETPGNVVSLVLEAQANVDCYFQCFARMYTPLKNKKLDVKDSLELLKVASQIEFHELMESTSLYLSSTFWSKEDEIRVRLYSSSPDFPRNHAKDLLARLGLDIVDTNELEDRHKQIWDATDQILRSAVKVDPEGKLERSDRAFVAELLQSLGPGTPYRFASAVINLLTNEAKDVLVSLGKDLGEGRVQTSDVKNKLMAVTWVLKALLQAKVAEELATCFLHLDAIPSALSECFAYTATYIEVNRKDTVRMAEVVFLMYGEVVAGHLVLSTLERMALLTNWHPLLKKVNLTAKDVVLKKGEMKLETKLKLVTTQLFSTLPLKEQMQFLQSHKNFDDFISNYASLISTLSESLASHGFSD